MGGTDLFVLSPPLVGVVQEGLKGLLFGFLFVFLLTFDLFFGKKFCFKHVREQIQVELDDTQRALVCQIHWLNLRVDLAGVAAEKGPPIDVLGSDHHWTFVSAVAKDSDMNGEVEPQKLVSVKTILTLLCLELEDEGFVEFKVTVCSNLASEVPTPKKADRNLDILIISWIDKVNEGSCTGDVAR